MHGAKVKNKYYRLLTTNLDSLVPQYYAHAWRL